jgi:hypothetical protein
MIFEIFVSAEALQIVTAGTVRPEGKMVIPQGMTLAKRAGAPNADDYVRHIFHAVEWVSQES